MVTFTLSDARNRHGEVFDRAIAEPVLLTKNARASHVVLSAVLFEQMVARLQELEDRRWASDAELARSESPRVGGEAFEAALKRLAENA